MAHRDDARERLTDAGFADTVVVEGGRLRASRSGQLFEPEELAVLDVVAENAAGGDDQRLLAVATSAGEPIGLYTTPPGGPGDEESEVIERLHRPPFSEEDIRAHQEHDHISAIFPSTAAAESAVDELRDLGLGSPQLGVAVHGGSTVAFEHDAEHDLEQDAAVGAGAGVAIGFLAGLTLIGLAVPGVGTFGVGGLLALGVSSAFGGGMIGAYLGVAAGDRAFSVHQELSSAALAEGEVLVAVCSHGHPEAVREAMGHHGGRLTAA